MTAPAELILCAVDESEAADTVRDTASWLADAYGARLDVVHAVTDPDQATDEDPGVRLILGSPASAIIATADQEGAELVVVGSRGRGTLRSAVLGSVSHDVALHARCPVVIVPPGRPLAAAAGEEADSPASVVCGIDGSDHALAAAAFAGQLARRLGLRLVIVHAQQNLRAMASYPGASSATPPVTGQEDSVAELAADVVQRAVEAADANAVGVLEPGPPTEVLESVADREDARLIVIATRGVGAVRAALLGSVAAELPGAAGRPVVVVSGPAAEALSAGT
jgi:nucleotide-binding universal stress UspA family protein